jgi:hypothetical protein
MLKKSVISRSCSNEADRIGDDWLVRHQEFFSESGALCSGVQDPALMLELDTEHFLYSSAPRNSEAILQKPYIHKAFFSCTVCRFTFCRFGRSYFVHPVRAPELLIPATSPFEVDTADAELKGYWSNPSKIFSKQRWNIIFSDPQAYCLKNNFLGSGKSL